MSFSLNSNRPLFSAYVSRFARCEITEEDFEEFPEIHDNQICSMGCNDKKRKYGNKTAVSVSGASKSYILEAISNQLKQLTGLKTINKYIICFFVYVLDSIKFGENTILKHIISDKEDKYIYKDNKEHFIIDFNNLDPQIRNFVVKLGNAVVIQNPAELSAAINNVLKGLNLNLELQLTDVQKRIENAKELFRLYQDENQKKIDQDILKAVDKSEVDKLLAKKLSFPVKDFFETYDKSLKKKVPSIYEYIIANTNLDDNEINTTYKFLDEGFRNQIYLLKHYNGDLTFGELYGKFMDTKSKTLEYYEIVKNKDPQEWNIPLSKISETPKLPELQSLEFDNLLEHISRVSQNTNTKKEGERVITKLYNFLVDRGLIKKNKGLTRIAEQFHVSEEVVLFYNTNRCVNDNDMFMESFKDEYMLKDIDKLMIVSGKYCLSMLDTALNIVSNGGVFKMPDPSVKAPGTEELIDRVCRFLVNHQNDNDVQEIVRSIETSVTKLQQTALKSPTINSSLDEWHSFYEYLMNDYVQLKKINLVKEVFKGSSNTVFELIGLLGYMCMADDISVFDNDGSFFLTSEYCKEQAKNMFNGELPNGVTSNFYNKTLLEIEINGKTIESLLKELDGGTCIHGIGSSFMRFYLGAYEAATVALPHIKYSNEHCKKASLMKILRELNSFALTLNPEITLISEDVLEKDSQGIVTYITEVIDNTIKNLIDGSGLDDEIKKSFTESSKNYKKEIQKIQNIQIKDIQNARLPPVPKDYSCDIYDKMFEIAPYVVVAPEYIRRNTGIEYLTAVLYDKSREMLLQNNPVNHTMLVFGYEKSPTKGTHCMYIRGTKFERYFKFDSVQEYFVCNGIPRYYVEDINFGSYFSTFYNDPTNIKHLTELVKIPFTFHKQRKQTFKVFLDYTLNMCRMMSASPSPDPKSLKLSKIARKQVFDLMEAEFVDQVPKYMTVIKHDQQEKLKPYENMHMWNSKFDNSKINVGKELDPSDRDYYIDTLENFVNLPYIIHDDKAIIKTPYTQQDVTKQCQVAQLLGKVLLRKTFDNIKPTLYVPTTENILSQYRQFESYFRVVNGQDSEIRSLFTSTMPKYKDLLKKFDIDGVSVVTNFSKITGTGDETKEFKQEIIKRLKLAIFVFYSKYYVELKVYPYYNALNSKYFSNTKGDIDVVLNLSTDRAGYQKNIVEMWGYILNDMVMSVCSEGLYHQAWQYHFTELNKEYFLLVKLGKEVFKPDYIPTIPVTDDHNLINAVGYERELYKRERDAKINELFNENKIQFEQAIPILKNTFAYFNIKDDDKDNESLKLIEYGNDNDHTETLPRVIEYAIKALLVREHQARTQGALLLVEKLINLLCKEDNFEILTLEKQEGTEADIKKIEERNKAKNRQVDAVNKVFGINIPTPLNMDTDGKNGIFTFNRIYNALFAQNGQFIVKADLLAKNSFSFI